VYPPDVFEEFMSVLNDPAAFAPQATRRGVTAAILHHPAPGRLELARAIARLPGWRIGYLDAGSIVLVADGQPPGDPTACGRRWWRPTPTGSPAPSAPRDRRTNALHPRRHRATDLAS
jgi:hypothetical protein